MDRWCLQQQQQQFCHGNEVSPRLKAKCKNKSYSAQKLTNHNGTPSNDITSPQAVTNNTSKDFTSNKTNDTRSAQQESDTDSDTSSLVAAMLESLDGGHVSSSSNDDRDFFDAVEQSRNESSPVETSSGGTAPLATNMLQSPMETDSHVDGPLEVRLS